MTKKIRIGIAGYGNLGRGVESAIAQNDDMELIGVFTRRNPDDLALLNEKVPVYAHDSILEFKEKIDVIILCGGSKNDLPEQGPALSKHFSYSDSFDTHAEIPKYFEAVDNQRNQTKILPSYQSVGIQVYFQLIVLFGEAVLSEGTTYTFWGKGLSQGHSDAVRRVAGVKGAVQYTIPNEGWS